MIFCIAGGDRIGGYNRPPPPSNNHHQHKINNAPPMKTIDINSRHVSRNKTSLPAFIPICELELKYEKSKVVSFFLNLSF